VDVCPRVYQFYYDLQLSGYDITHSTNVSRGTLSCNMNVNMSVIHLGRYLQTETDLGLT